MTLETLANDIAAAAESDAALIAEAKRKPSNCLQTPKQKQQPCVKKRSSVQKKKPANRPRNGGERSPIQSKGRPDCPSQSARCNPRGCTKPHCRPRHEGRAALLKSLLTSSKKLAKGNA